MRRACHLAGFAGLLASILAGCDRAPPRSETGVLSASARTAAGTSPREPFEQPLPNGWGRAEGLEYREFVRGAAAPDAPLPMVMIIHGMGDQPGEHWFSAIHIDFPARVIMPQAPTPYLDGFSWFSYRVADNEPQALGRAIAEMADRLARALTALQAHRPTVGRPIVAGFSQGGMLSLALAVRHPEQVQLALPIGGMLPGPIWPHDRAATTANPPIRALHGEQDSVVPIGPTHDLVAQLQRLGYDASLQAFDGVGHSISPAMQPVIEQALTEAARRLGPAGR
jgi:phospholipase/carboxylesterase